MASEKALRTRQKILDASRSIILKQGAGALSMDAVVKEFKTSKGAFLYHFKNKKSLYKALVEEYVVHLDERLQTHMDMYPDAKDPFVLGYAARSRSFDRDDGGYAALGIALLALNIHDPEALEPFRQWYGKIFRKIQDSGQETSHLLSAIMAFEGFFFVRKLGFNGFDEKTKDELWTS